MYTIAALGQLTDESAAKYAPIADQPAAAELLAQLASAADQLAQAIAKADDLGKQTRAATRREADLQQQLAASQNELARLGFMQLGRKMIVKAEQDNIRKKLATNLQLQQNLTARLQACHEKQAALEAQLDASRSALDELLAAPPTAPGADIPEPADAPPTAEALAVPVEETPAPAAAPAAVRPARPRSAAPKAPAKSAGPRKPRAPRIRTDLPPQEQAVQLLTRLEAYYPEHQVFAMDSICAELRDKLSAVCAICGCDSLGELLRQHGWQLVTGAEGRALRHGKYCTPGQEPEAIRPLLRSTLARLEKHYPDRIIHRSIQQDHKSLAQDVSGLYQYLGYDSAAAMLDAYGFRYQVAGGGRPATDVQALMDALQSAYADAPRPRTIAQLVADHPEHARAIKTLQNQSPTRFGMSFKQYLVQKGILAGKADQA